MGDVADKLTMAKATIEASQIQKENEDAANRVCKRCTFYSGRVSKAPTGACLFNPVAGIVINGVLEWHRSPTTADGTCGHFSGRKMKYLAGED